MECSSTSWTNTWISVRTEQRAVDWVNELKFSKRGTYPTETPISANITNHKTSYTQRFMMALRQAGLQSLFWRAEVKCYVLTLGIHANYNSLFYLSDDHGGTQTNIFCTIAGRSWEKFQAVPTNRQYGTAPTVKVSLKYSLVDQRKEIS